MVISIPIPMPSLQSSAKPNNSLSEGMPPYALTPHITFSYVLVQFTNFYGLSPMVSSSTIDARPLPSSTPNSLALSTICALNTFPRQKPKAQIPFLLIYLNTSLQYFMIFYLFIYFEQCYLQTPIKTLEHIAPPFSCLKKYDLNFITNYMPTTLNCKICKLSTSTLTSLLISHV